MVPSAGPSDVLPTPTTTDSSAPSPSPEEGGPYVEPIIVDRPGVPPSLYDKYWTAGNQAGQVGTTARIVMPPGEAILAVGAGQVASIVIDDNLQPVITPDGVAITVRDVRTGATLRRVDTQVYATQAVFVGSLLFWAGRALPIDGPVPADGGVWMIDLADAESTARTIVPAADLTLTYGPRAARGLLRVTDRGRAVTTLIESEITRATEVIDVVSLTSRPIIEGEFAVEIVDDLAIVSPLHEDLAGASRSTSIRLLDLATAKDIGLGIDTAFVKSSVVGEDEVFVQFARGLDSYIAAISLVSGDARTLRTQVGGTETFDLSSALSAPDLLVLLPVSQWTVDAEGKVQIPVTLLDPATGQLQQAFTIGAP